MVISGYPRLIRALLSALLLSGCGTYVPSFHEFYDTTDSDTMIEAITEHVQCEVKDAVQFLILDDQDAAAFKSQLTGEVESPSLDWLYKWAAQITLIITVDEKSMLNPSITFTPPQPSATATFGKITTTTPQSILYGFGAMGSLDATRKGTISWLIKFEDLTDDASLAKAKVRRDHFYKLARETGAKKIPPTCNKPGILFLEGDLEFRGWLYEALLAADVKNGILGDFSKAMASEASVSKKDAIQDDITFVVLYGGSFNPVWKLLRIAAGQAAPPLFGVQRTRTQDVLITLGAIAPDGTLTQAAQNQALASLIGIAVGNAVRNTQ